MAPMSQKTDNAHRIALQKDIILSLLDNKQLWISAKMMLQTRLDKHTFDDYIKEMSQQDLISVNHGGPFNADTFGLQLTERGSAFLKKGGYKELWRDEMEEMVRMDEIEAKREADRNAIESEKLKLERKKVGISILALLVSIIGICWSSYTSWRSASNNTAIMDRVQILESRVLALPDSLRINSLEQVVFGLRNELTLKTGTPSIQKFSTGEVAGQQK